MMNTTKEREVYNASKPQTTSQKYHSHSAVSSSLRSLPVVSSYHKESTGRLTSLRGNRSNKLLETKTTTMQKGGYVYIMCSMNNTTLYTGVTSTIGARVTKHKENFYPNGFTEKYNCKKLVYYKWFDTIIEAIAEEKRIKGGSRKKKEILINSMNPGWNDLYDQIKLF